MKKMRTAIKAALLLLAAGAAFAQDASTAVTRLAWVDAEGNPLDEVHINDTVYAYADAANIPDGTEVSVTIFEYNEDEGLPDDYITQLSVAVQGGAIRAAWEVTHDEEQTDTQCAREIADRGYTIPRYRFRVRYGSAGSPAGNGGTYRSAFSASLTAWDSMNVQVKDAGANTRFILDLADGTNREVFADDEGYLRAFRLPPGLVRVIMDHTYFTDDGADFDDEVLADLYAAGTAEEVRIVIDAGADVNAHNRGGRTPLTIAARYNDADVMRVLLETGADVNARDEGAGRP